MAFHVHAALAALCVAFVATQAHLPGQIYWNSMLPDVAMPTAISDALVSSGKIEKIVLEGSDKDEIPVNTPAENFMYLYNHGSDKDKVSVNTPTENFMYLYDHGSDKDKVPVNTSAENFMYLYDHGSDKDKVPVNTPAENFMYLYDHGGDKDKVPVNTPAENFMYLYNHGSDKDKVPVNTPAENFMYLYNHGIDKDKVPLNTPAENFMYLYHDGGDKEEVVVNPPTVHFFLENDLVPGKQWELEFPKPESDGYIFIPRQVADSIPFSSNKLSAILTQLSIDPESQKAQLMKDTLRHCDSNSNPVGEGEVRTCATSLEAMIDFAIQRLGKNIQAVSTEPSKFTKLQNFTILPDLKRIGDDKVVSCHHVDYPYAVLFCHDLVGARAYSIPLVGTTDGTKVKAVAVCHTNTSTWNPEHLAFRVLKVKPGGEPVCHLLPLHNLIWTEQPHLAMSASGF